MLMQKISYSRCRQSLADNTDQIILLTQIDIKCLNFSKNSFKNNIRKLVIICNKGQISLNSWDIALSAFL